LANAFYMDASALAKRYFPERGSAHVDIILDTVPPDRICVLNVSVGEVVSILVRKRNAGTISAANFAQALINFEAEIVHSAAIAKLPIGTRLAVASLSLIVRHSINSTDAVTLKSALILAAKRRGAGDDVVLVASDQRLLRAAGAEGLITFDPEQQDLAALTAVISL